jgi:CheY-like chemotaxis protein
MRTILVADDEFDLASTLRAILEGEGYRVVTCANGREAMEQLAAAPPDLVMMDVMMPYLSGYDVVKRMRQTPGLDAVPVVLMNAVPPAEDGAWQAFLRKPFTLDVLLRTVGEALGPAAARG